MEINNTKTYQIERGKDIQKWTLTCPLCKEEFDYEFDTKEGYNFETECPHCGISIIGTGTVTTWGCDYCSERFHSMSEVERHEEKCINRPM
jgi:phage terminase large subunit GpA-like protein